MLAIIVVVAVVVFYFLDRLLYIVCSIKNKNVFSFVSSPVVVVAVVCCICNWLFC